MTLAALCIAAILGGVGVGYVLQRLPMTPLLQTTGAAFISWVGVSVAAIAFWLLKPVGGSGIFAVSVGLGETALSCAGVIAGAALLHAGLGWLGSHGIVDVITYRPIIAGVLSGLATLLLQHSALR